MHAEFDLQPDITQLHMDFVNAFGKVCFCHRAIFVKCNLQNAKCKMQNAKCKMQNAKCKMQDARCKMQNADAKCKMQTAK